MNCLGCAVLAELNQRALCIAFHAPALSICSQRVISMKTEIVERAQEIRAGIFIDAKNAERVERRPHRTGKCVLALEHEELAAMPLGDMRAAPCRRRTLGVCVRLIRASK